MRPLLTRIWSARRAIALWLVLIAAGTYAGHYFMDLAVPEMRPQNEPMIHRMVMMIFLVFVLAAAIPFVPGAEIGFGLLLVFGGQASFLVYTGMVSALLISYCIGRLVPLGTVIGFLNWLGLSRIAEGISQFGTTPEAYDAANLSQRFGEKLGRILVKNRYLLLIVLLNTPGNSVIGGAGGLAFGAGFSRMYGFGAYVLSVLIAVLPIPLFFYLFRS